MTDGKRRNKMFQLRLLSLRRNYKITVPQSGFLLRPPQGEDYEQWSKLREESREFLKPWEPTWPADDLTPIGFQRRLRSYDRQRRAGTGQTFFLFDSGSIRLIGGLSLTRIMHGFSRSATLGYWMGKPYANKGVMQQCVPALLDFAFQELRLQRVEAACLPVNSRSRHLLQKCGFKREGFAKKYLEINGQREDHVLLAVLKSDLPKLKSAENAGKPYFTVV